MSYVRSKAYDIQSDDGIAVEEGIQVFAKSKDTTKDNASLTPILLLFSSFQLVRCMVDSETQDAWIAAY